MPWTVLVWLLCFCLQSALVGVMFYQVTQLSDFEMDYQNNFDTAKNCNRWVVRSYKIFRRLCIPKCGTTSFGGILFHASIFSRCFLFIRSLNRIFSMLLFERKLALHLFNPSVSWRRGPTKHNLCWLIKHVQVRLACRCQSWWYNYSCSSYQLRRDITLLPLWMPVECTS